MFKIEITANSVTELKKKLQKHLAEFEAGEAVQAPTPTTPVTPIVPTAPVTSSVPTPTAPVPTAAPQYTYEQLALAASTLAEANPDAIPQLNAIVRSYAVQGLSEIPPGQLGEVAQSFRQLGAVI